MGSQYARPWLQPAQYVRNGKYPDAFFQGEIAALANHIAAFRLKEIARFGMTTSVIASDESAVPRPRWRTRYTASPYVRAVVIQGWLAQSGLTHLEDAYALFDFGVTGATAELHYGSAGAENANPDHCAVLWTLVGGGGGGLWAPTPGTTYDLTISDYRSRIVAATVYEASLSSSDAFSEGYAAGTPILDTDRGDITAYARQAWKTQAAPLFTWTVDDQSAPRSTTSATAKNLIDDTSTTVSGATVGFTIDLRNRSRVSTGTVPCVFEAYGSTADVGYVQLMNSSGTVLATVEIEAATGWFSTTVNLPATRAKYDVHYVSSGEMFTVSAVRLEQHASGT